MEPYLKALYVNREEWAEVLAVLEGAGWKPGSLGETTALGWRRAGPKPGVGALRMVIRERTVELDAA